jgi:hypothetical protein
MGDYILTLSRADFIHKHFLEWSFGRPLDQLPDRDKFEMLTHPAELHYLAYIYNWDDGPVVMEWIVDSPLCSKATANLIFWLVRPDYYTRYDLNAVNETDDYDDDLEVLRVLRKILEKHKKDDFHGCQIAFDPEDELEELMERRPKWTVPPALYEKLEGDEMMVETRPEV